MSDQDDISTALAGLRSRLDSLAIKDTEGISYEAGFLPNLAAPYGTP